MRNKVKKYIEYFVVFVIFIVLIDGDLTAHYYSKNILPIWVRTMPKGLRLEELDLDFAIVLDGEEPLGVIFPEAEFMLDESIYVEQLIEYCIHRSFISVLVRTDKNELKIITIKSVPSKLDALPLEERFEYKIYTPEEFYSDTSIFKNVYYYYDVYVPCTYLRSQPFIVRYWWFTGRCLLLILTGWLGWKLYNFMYKINNKDKQEIKEGST